MMLRLLSCMPTWRQLRGQRCQKTPTWPTHPPDAYLAMAFLLLVAYFANAPHQLEAYFATTSLLLVVYFMNATHPLEVYFTTTPL